MIKPGDTLPDAVFATPTDQGPNEVTTADVFGGKKAVLFAVPGAFTPTCHANHMPGYVAKLDEFKAKGVDTIACVSVNDVFVMKAWGEATGALGAITLLADGSALFAKAMGLDLDLTERGLGMRSKRYAVIVEDRVVKHVFVEETPATADASGAENVLEHL